MSEQDIELGREVFNQMETPLNESVFLQDCDRDIRTIAAAIIAERERCAKIAERAEAAYGAALEEVAKDETFQWAMDEMSDSVDERLFGAVRGLFVAAKIREGK